MVPSCGSLETSLKHTCNPVVSDLAIWIREQLLNLLSIVSLFFSSIELVSALAIIFLSHFLPKGDVSKGDESGQGVVQIVSVKFLIAEAPFSKRALVQDSGGSLAADGKVDCSSGISKDS